ncbi:acyl-CoA N-acyltransferase [Globomyces pollinis-pini]|nr:acyl-CoA N-acyltransferase [Globomyces pollinis-pini]KAJ2998348.1 hypothetical protein HDV02_004563 [Globomyces sp. JEL0801]
MSSEKFVVTEINDRVDMIHAFLIRIKVFVEEQKVPGTEELDLEDLTAHHFLLTDKEKQIPCGTIRLTEDADGQGILGRLCILKEYRSLGLGKLLVNAVERKANELQYKKIRLHGQLYAEKFYTKCGYLKEDLPHFMECGIEHIHMVKFL